MPALSVVIPFRHDNASFESTLLSVLENRAEDIEVIVPHDGSYDDPYDLADEVKLVPAAAGTSLTELVNLALQVSTAPVINTLLAGVTVEAGWCDAPLSMFAREPLAAVSVAVHAEDQKSCGVDKSVLADSGQMQRQMQRGQVHTSRASASAAPDLRCGYYQREVLEAVGGFWQTDSPAVADVELAIALQELNLDVDCERETRMQAADESQVDLLQLAQIAAARGAKPVAGLSGLFASLTATISGKSADHQAWQRGLQQPATQRMQQRVEAAIQYLQAEEFDEDDLQIHAFPTAQAEATPMRRAA